MEESIERKNLIVMKLLHYFIIEKNYNPVILQGAEDEIWLENLDSNYKIIRIVSNYIHNDEQLKFDLFKTTKVTDKIKKKTFSLNMNVLNIYTDLGENAHLEDNAGKNISCIYLFDETDIDKYKFFTDAFVDIKNKLQFSEEGLQLFMKITSDINNKNKNDAVRAEEIFKSKKPIVTYVLVGINVFIYLFFNIIGNYELIVNEFCLYGPLVRIGQYYRIITSMFLHADIFHLMFNCYALYVIGAQIESFMGKRKYILIYFISGIFGSLLSMILSGGASIGASGAIFGLMGSLLYFGYHYRVYLGTVLRNQIIPLIAINLLYGFVVTGIDNFAHIGGLIGGILVTISVGVKYKSTRFEMINGLIVTILSLIFLSYMAIVFVK